MRVAQKKLFLNIVYSRKAMTFLKLLYLAGLVTNYYIFKIQTKNWIKIFPTFYRKLPLSKHFKLITTPSRTFFISYKALLLLQKRTHASTFLLSTHKGLITHNTAINLKIGGVLIGFVFN